MINHDFNQYGFVEGVDFDGLAPKLMEELGEEYTIGKVDEPVVSMYDPTANGVDSMKVVNVQKLAELDEE